MNTTKTQMVNVTINDVVFTIDIVAAIKLGIATPVRTHKMGNYYRDIDTGVIYILMCYGNRHRVSLVRLTGWMHGYREPGVDVNNVHRITEDEFTYIKGSRVLELIDNPMVK